MEKTIKNLANGINASVMESIDTLYKNKDISKAEYISFILNLRSEIQLNQINSQLKNLFSNIDKGTASVHQLLLSSLVKEIKMKDSKRLEPFGFSGGSQNDEDGIINEIFSRIGTKDNIFVEIGVGVGTQNNTVYLLKTGWKGYWIEANEKKNQHIMKSFAPFIEKNLLKLKQSFVNKDNINNLFKIMEIPKNFDLLSIDIDGNDYYILKALELYNPRVIVTEYNGVYRPPVEIIQKYNPNYEFDYNTYMGASLWALKKLLNKKGYALVGTDIIGLNAFFVKYEDLNDKFSSVDDSLLYNQSRSQLAWGGAFHYGPGMNNQIGELN